MNNKIIWPGMKGRKYLLWHAPAVLCPDLNDIDDICDKGTDWEEEEDEFCGLHGMATKPC